MSIWLTTIVVIVLFLFYLFTADRSEGFIPLSISKHFWEESSQSLDMFYKRIPTYDQTKCK
jgi:hypothetical protein